MEKIQLHLYKYEDSQFKQIAIIDNYQEYSFEHNLYQAGQFTVTINFNIPNARLFERGLFIKFGEDKYCFGEILTISDTVGPNGKGSQIRNITGFDIRYLLKRRVIKNMNNGGNWVMTDKGEICLRNLINDQCGANAENKRKLPIINTIPLPANAIGKEYSVSEEFSNLYEVCKTIATQSEFGWHIKFENGLLTLECFEGNDLRNSVFFSPDFDSLASGNLSDSNNSFSNAIYVAGKGQNEERDLYEGETVENDVTPEGMGRFESFDNQSQMTTEDEYKAEAFSMLAQYGQTLEMTGQGLIKCPYVFKEQYNVGDKITLSFNNKKSVVQILAVTERSVKGTYSLNFNFGKPENTLKDQLQIILRKLQMASNKGSAVDCVKWYTIPTDSEMNKADVTFNTIGFTGNNSNQDFTFTLYTDDEKTGSKNYMVYIKNLIGTGKLILTSGKQDAQNLSLLGGTYIANIFVDEDGNVKLNSATPTTVIEANNPMPATSGAVYEAIQQGGDSAIVPSITQEQYNNLTEAEKNDGKIREITDAEGFPVPFAIMNDEMTTSANVLSAQETENRIVAKVTEHPYIMHTVEYGTKWYRLYSDGWCEQGDYGTLNGSESPVQVTFLIPFKTINYSLAIALNENISSAPYWNDFGYDRTENGFKLRTWNKTSWIASGFVDLNNIPEIN